MSNGNATELRGMVNYLLEQAQRREDEASRHPANSPTRIHFAAMAEADRDTAAELGILARQFAQAQADQQARLRALVEGWREEAKQFEFFAGAQYADGSRNAFGRCADELETVLGGKE